MNGAESGLLDIACTRIAGLTLPAFVKDSQLRYVAVNEAYARFVGRSVSEFPGRVSEDFLREEDCGMREDRERRTLVFGTEESTFVTEPGSGRRHVLDIERFITEDDRFYVFGVMEWGSALRQSEAAKETERLPVAPVAGVEHIFDGPDRPAVSQGFENFPDMLLAGHAFDVAEIGIALFDADGVLVYQNDTEQRFYKPVLQDIGPGHSLYDILGRFWDYSVFAEGEAPADRDAWINTRIASHENDDHEHVDRLPDGRYVRLISRRLENGGLLVVTNDVTEAKRQEELLREQVRATEIYRSALEGLPVAVFLRDDFGRLTYANAAYEEILGDDRSKFLGKDEKEMFPAAWERFRTENRHVIDTGEPIEKSEAVVFVGDRALPIITRLNRIEAPGGEPFVVGSITDVSLLKVRENELVEARSHADKLRGEIETILHSLPVGVMILDSDFIVDYANDAFYHGWVGDYPEELIGRPYRDFVRINFERGAYGSLDQDFDALYETRVRSFTDRSEEPFEVVGRDGKVLIISNMALPNGKYLQTNYDITAVRKREQEAHEAQAALERLGALMRDATSVMSQGLLILRDGIIELSNDALPEMMHVPPEMLAPGRAWRDMFGYLAARGDFGTQEEATALLRDWEERISRRESITTSFHAGGKTWLHFEVNLSGLDHWLAIFTDVTEMKLREEELTRLLNRAEAADRAKSEFLANMSHEIRTPMNGVLGMAELLAKSDLDPRQKTFTDIIVKSGNALLTIINDILDFSKIDAGQMKLRSLPFDPVEAIEDVASLLSTSATQKDIELVVRGAEGHRHVVIGDAGRFRQIVTNLVGNAVKFTEKGHVLIDFRFEPIDNGRQMLTLRIADTGIGIPADKMQSIFDKFSQVDSSNTRRHEGTGLGLSITAGLVDLFGGVVTAHSEPGRGSIFTVTLPFQVAGERQAPRPLPVNVRGAHILVLDDNAVNREILTEQLSVWGFDAVACGSGDEACAILKAARDAGITVDAVLSDFPMNGNEAVHMAERMRDHPHYAAIPIIFLTSMEAAGSESLFASLNVRAHLMKPPRVDLLRTTVIDVVRAARLRRGVTGDEAVRDLALAPAVPNLPPLPEAISLPLRSGGLDILVAEDNEVNQIVFTQILQATGLSFRIVNNGQEAVEAWRTDAPSIILMDVSMPVMNGHQATRLIRQIEAEEGAGQHVPIIGVTAHALERDRDLCLESGMDDYLSKPISPELLESKIRRWFGLEAYDGARTESTF